MENKERPDKIVGESGRTKFFKKHIDTVVELACLRAMLGSHATLNRVPPKDWRKTVTKMKQAPKCQAVYTSCHRVLAQADESDFETLAIRLAAQISKAKLPN
jgi:hypothetical protein